MQFRDDPSTNAKLDFLEQFHADAARGGVHPLDEYARRFPELEGWLGEEYARLVVALHERTGPSASPEPVVDVDEARLLAELAARRSDGGRYRRTAELGRGGTSSVFSVRDIELGRDLAMKVLRREGRSSLRRFLREARITARLEHPGVLPVHELGLDAHGEPFFTMRLVRGASLKSLFDELRPTAGRKEERAESLRQRDVLRRRAITALLGVCDTMAFAHARRVIHRDLKPANVMVGDFGEVYVVDWGLARELGEHEGDTPTVSRHAANDESFATLDGDVLGTPAYMPPEQAQGELARIGPSVDVYAVGAMLYQLLTGRAPYFDGEATPDSRTVLDRVLAGPPRDLAEFASDAPPELVAIVRRAMARDPEHRYPSCAELGADLRAFLERRIVLAHASGPWTRAKKWVRRNPALASSLLLVLLAGTAGLVGWRRAKAKEADLALLATLRGPLELLLDFDALWPLDAHREAALRDWLARADVLRREVPRYESRLAALRATGERLPLPAWLQAKEVEKRESLLRQARASIEQTRAMLYDAESRLSAATDEAARASIDAEAGGARLRLASLERERRMIEARSPARIVWSFADPHTQLLHDRIDAFVSEFELACGRDDESGEVRLVRAALSALERARALDTHAWRRAWDEVLPRITAAERYAGLELAPDVHLWPLGPDPRSGLFEFAHILTGHVPERTADGTLALDTESALVLVLVPGATKCTIGAQSGDPDAPWFDPHVRTDEAPLLELSLDAYLVGKHEISRAQWARLTGEPLQEYWVDAVAPYAKEIPAAGMTGVWARTVLGAYGMCLPSAARWEVAARGGTRSIWWTGNDPESLKDAANVADSRWVRDMLWTNLDVPGAVAFDDGWSHVAPVGALRANGFGLHDVAGNVAEWCADVSEPRMTSTTPPDGRFYPRTAGLQIVHGGAFEQSALDARSAARSYVHPEFRAYWLGVRAARDLVVAPR